MAEYARVIVDISQDKLDKTFEYRIPVYLQAQIAVGTQVHIPFGRRRLTGYVVELTDETEYDADKIKDVFVAPALICRIRVTEENDRPLALPAVCNLDPLKVLELAAVVHSNTFEQGIELLPESLQ